MAKIKNQLLPLILSVLILSFLTAYWIFASWDEPTSDPPTGNVAAPINTGSADQTKEGALSVKVLKTIQGTGGTSLIIRSGGDLEIKTFDNTGGALFYVDDNEELVIRSRLKVEESLILTPLAIAPTTCDSTSIGMIYYNSTENMPKVCDSSSWKNYEGPEGDPGAAGSEGLVWQGTWSSLTAYLIDDAVTNNGSSYIATTINTNQEPPNAAYWNVLASKGNQGPVGPEGPEGPVGSEFWDENITTGNIYNTNTDGDIVIRGDEWELGQKDVTSIDGRGFLIERINDSSGEGSGRIFFSENNNGVPNNYGLSLYYQGSASATLPSGMVLGDGNATWALMRHDNSVNGLPIMSGTRQSSDVAFSGNINLEASKDIRWRNRTYDRIYDNNYLLNIDFSNGIVMDYDSNNNDGGYFSIEDAGTSRFYIKEGGNVGIGITSPVAKLHVVSSGDAAARFTGVGGVEFGTNMNFDVDRTNFHTIAPSSNFHIDSKSGGSIYLNYYSGNNVYFGTGAGSATGIWKSNGSVGIGTISPRANTLLDVAGALGVSRQGISGTYNSSEIQGIWSINPYYKISTENNDFGTQYGITYAHTYAGTSGDKKPIANWGHQILFTSNGNRKAVISLTSGHAYFAGNIGIGDISPDAKLDILNTGTGASFRVDDIDGDSTPFIIDANGNVGIGRASPSATLHVYRPDTDIAKLYVTGSNQGSGMVYVGQSVAYGGGLSYDGDGNPGMVGDNDRITFFRRSNGTDSEVFSYIHNSDDVRFSGDIDVEDEIRAGSGGYDDASFGVQRVYSNNTTGATIWSHPKDPNFKMTWDGDDGKGELCVCTGSIKAHGVIDSAPYTIWPGAYNCQCNSAFFTIETWDTTFFQLSGDSKGFMFWGVSDSTTNTINGMVTYWY